jgi:hypothetical protein
MHYFARILMLITYCVATSALVGVAWPLSGPREITVKELIPLVSWQKQFKITEGTDRGNLFRSSLNPISQTRRDGGSYSAIMRAFSWRRAPAVR